MKPRRVALAFMVFLAVFVVMSVLWLGVGDAYARAFRWCGERMFLSFGEEGAVGFKTFDEALASLAPDVPVDRSKPVDFATFRAVLNRAAHGTASGGSGRVSQFADAPSTSDTLMMFARYGVGQFHVFPVSSHEVGYVPTAIVVSLIVASPIPWRRKWKAILIGLVAVSAYVALRMLAIVLYHFSAGSPVALWSPGPTVAALLGYMYWVLYVSFAGWLLGPLPIWFLVTFRREDWQTSGAVEAEHDVSSDSSQDTPRARRRAKGATS